MANFDTAAMFGSERTIFDSGLFARDEGFSRA
jgi:hypothetical protein